MGVFQNNKKVTNGMDKKLFEQKEAMEDKKKEFTRNNEELQDFGREIVTFQMRLTKNIRNICTKNLYCKF